MELRHIQMNDKTMLANIAIHMLEPQVGIGMRVTVAGRKLKLSSIP
jgi:hypothetical protein